MTQVAGDAEGANAPQAADSAQPEYEDGDWVFPDQSHLEELLHEYADARSIRSGLESNMEATARLLKTWLDNNPGQELRDDERGYRAYLQARRGAKTYDLVTIWDKDRTLFERLLRTGCIVVNAKAVEVQVKAGQVTGVDRYASLPSMTAALQVVKT